MSAQKGLTIGQLAKSCHVHVETIRYYQKLGLLPTPSKSSSGIRYYPEPFIRQITSIRHAKELGLTLKDIRSLLNMENTHCSEARNKAVERLNQIEEKIQSLIQQRNRLKNLIGQCDNRPRNTPCPIVDSLKS